MSLRTFGFAIALAMGLAASAGWAQTTPPAATAMPGMTMPMTKPATAMPTTAMPAMPSMKPAAMMTPVNINTATAGQLDAIPQIGPKRAAKIIQNRPYKTVDDLLAKKVLSKGIFDKIKGHIAV